MVVQLVRLILPLGAAAALCAGLATAGAPAATGGPPVAAAGHGHAGAPATAARRRRRPGCGRFCRQAGGFGGGPGEAGPVVMPAQTIRVASDGIIAVKATCKRSKRCIGAILVDGHVSYGRADLRIAGNATRRVEVAVPSAGIKYLRRHGRDKTGFATVALTDNTPISISKTLTLLPPR